VFPVSFGNTFYFGGEAMKLAVVGATGEVGRMMLKKLEEESIEPDGIDLSPLAEVPGVL
jgi:aspartate-semialdehyde dehydrogenase